MEREHEEMTKNNNHAYATRAMRAKLQNRSEREAQAETTVSSRRCARSDEMDAELARVHLLMLITVRAVMSMLLMTLAACKPVTAATG